RIQASHPRVQFVQADCMNPSTLIGPWVERPHPWLLIEDAHRNTFAVLEQFHPYLRPGDYLIVEDTAFLVPKYRQLERFIISHNDAYKVDTRYTDLFGYNGTFSFNGYIRRV